MLRGGGALVKLEVDARGDVHGGVGRTLGSEATGSAFSFATTYALTSELTR